jgi:hypothetical protein
MSDTGRSLVEAMHRQAAERGFGTVPQPGKPLAVHYSELMEALPGEALAVEWNTYRQEIERLLRQGQEGRYVLIKDNAVIGIYDTWEAAREAGLSRFLLEPFLVHPIRSEEPYLRVRGLNYPCPS